MFLIIWLENSGGQGQGLAGLGKGEPASSGAQAEPQEGAQFSHTSEVPLTVPWSQCF